MEAVVCSLYRQLFLVLVVRKQKFNLKKMQVLQVTQKSFDSIGFGRKLKPFNHLIRKNFVLSIPGLTLLWTYLLHGTSCPQEYMESFYVVTACSCVVFCTVSLIFCKNKLFSFIDCVEELIGESR